MPMLRYADFVLTKPLGVSGKEGERLVCIESLGPQETYDLVVGESESRLTPKTQEWVRVWWARDEMTIIEAAGSRNRDGDEC